MRSLFRSIVVLLVLATAPLVPLRAQMPPARYTPNVDLTNAAYLRALARLPGGKVVVAGNDLQRVGGIRQNYLARLNADGSLDSSWNPAPNGGVGALWVDAAGMLYVGGFFNTIAGQPRAGLARFNAAGVLDPNWTPTLNGGANAIAPGLPGSICFGGTFTQVNGITHNRLACVSDIDGSLISAFAPDVNNTVSSLLSSGNNLYVGGYFSSISATPRLGAARLALNGAGLPDAWNPAPNNVVLAFLPTPSGEVYLAGFFSFLGATSRPGIAKVNGTTGAVITAFNAQMAFNNYALDLCSDGGSGIVAVGPFTAIGGQPRLNIARLDGITGNAIAGFDPSVDYGYPVHVLAEPGGSYLVGGPFSSLGGGEHLALGRVLANGSIDAAFSPTLEAQGYGYVIARLPADGAFVVGGRFVRADGLIRRNLFKLALPGRVDPNWIANTDEDVRALAVDDIGRIYVSGDFVRVGSYARPHLARLQNTTDGAVDSTWNPQADGTIYSALLRPEGLYVSGPFGTIGGGAQASLARLSLATGNVDSGWKPIFTGGGAGSMAVSAGGDLLVTGNFTNVNGMPRSGAAKLATGAAATLDFAWAPAFGGGAPSALAVDGDDVYLGGTFTSVNSMARGGLARVSASGAGALDPAWTPSANNQSAKLLPQPEGIYVAGYFSSVNGSGHGYLARLDKVTGAIDPSWVSSTDNWVLDLLPHHGSIVTAGWFTNIGGQPRQGVARLPVAGDTIFVDDFSG
jgi:uncharacterized delta-60 repeat protein